MEGDLILLLDSPDQLAGSQGRDFYIPFPHGNGEQIFNQAQGTHITKT